MSISHETMRRLLDQGAFEALFIEHLGWDNPPAPERTVVLPEDEIVGEQVASKRGVGVWRIDGIPPSLVRRRIDVEVSKLTRERLLVFVEDHEQLWLWPEQRSSGTGYRLIEHRYYPRAKNEALLQRLGAAAFTIDEEASLTVMDVLSRVRRSFNADEVTKRFYREFKKHHDNLLEEVEGIEDATHLSWYGSVLLNRLMFIYFMQKKGFLDDDRDYLGNRLRMVRRHLGPDAFYGFFRDFLLPLFHEGLGSHLHRYEDPDIARIIGDVPYVNGGIFSPHLLETTYKIDVPDRAFEEIFGLFDRYRWHLDERPSDDPNEINPDVLGYIFEQYVNQKEQGAYYTKEDVTGYMTGATVIPAFLDRLEAVDEPWILLTVDPDRYIHESVRYGVDEPLPDSIAAGMENPDQRMGWSDKAPPSHGLPGETWWEVIDRHRYYRDLRARLEAAEIRDVNAAITSNLDLRTLANDYLRTLAPVDEVEHAYRVLTDLTILDPTCGSGAFLFAALEILEGLYESLLDRAEELRPAHREASFVEDVRTHPNPGYFILKTALLSNLYGVDIMHEAGEIARLRLFLKLVAQLRRKDELEPLPDLDFNIRTGNLLVGIADVDDAKTRLGADLFGLAKLGEIQHAAEEAAGIYEEFVSSQRRGVDPDEIRLLKVTVAEKLGALRGDLDYFLYEARGESMGKHEWVESHQPFHWFIEFPGVFRDGGFDVVIGNPPYVSRRKVSRYTWRGHVTNDLPDIYAPCVERAARVLRDGGRFAMVVPLNVAFGQAYQPLRELLANRFDALATCFYGVIPAGLFSGVSIRCSIIVGAPAQGNRHLRSSSHLHRWIADYRPFLFETLKFTEVPASLDGTSWAKVGSQGTAEILRAMTARGGQLGDSSVSHGSPLYFKKAARYWFPVSDVPPPSFDRRGRPLEDAELGVVYFPDEATRDVALAALSGKVAALWWSAFGDDFHVLASSLTSFPVSLSSLSADLADSLTGLARELRDRIASGSVTTFKLNAGKWIGGFDLRLCRDITDMADRQLLKQYRVDDCVEDLDAWLAAAMTSVAESPSSVSGRLPTFES